MINKHDNEEEELNEFELLIETIEDSSSLMEAERMTAEAIGELVTKAIAAHQISEKNNQLFLITIKRWNTIYSMKKIVVKVS